MQNLPANILAILKAFSNWFIIWIIGPDGIIFDLQSILKILISGAILLWQLCKARCKILCKRNSTKSSMALWKQSGMRGWIPCLPLIPASRGVCAPLAA